MALPKISLVENAFVFLFRACLILLLVLQIKRKIKSDLYLLLI